ncbi:MAG TPA: hypothetical protein PKK33_11495, partial [Candidatus Cloacimonadota bacterium]|nr:hypothetical protein [Candidatus Cloacimonadota bacterium]
NPAIQIPVELTINPVSAPIGILLTKQATGTLLSWNPVPYAGIYHVYRAVYPNGSYVKITDVTAASYLDEGADSDTYFYYVTAE